MTKAALETSQGVELHFVPSTLDLRADVEFEIARRRVFDALMHVASWWPHRPWPSTRVVLEARVGGRFFEDRDDGCGILLGHLTRLLPPGDFEVVGPLGLDGLANATWSVRLDADDDARGAGHGVRYRTRLHGRFRAFGVIDDEIRRAAPEYWEAVYNGLARFIHA